MAQDGDIAEVEAPEEMVTRVAAIDVAKASGMVGTRVPHPAKPGQHATKVWQVPATTNAIIELAEQLAYQGIQRVVVESTSDYWRPFVYLLQARGLVVWLVNRPQRSRRPDPLAGVVRRVAGPGRGPIREGGASPAGQGVRARAAGRPATQELLDDRRARRRPQP